MLFKVQDFIKARKMARLKKSTGVCASNIPTTRSKTSASKARKNVSEDIPIQPEELQPFTSRGSVKKRRYRPGSKALKEIRRYQRGTGLLVPKSPFKRVIQQISQELTRNANFRFTAEALECLQVASEAMIVQLFEDSVLVMVNAKRMTLMVRDLQLVRRIRGCF